MLMITCIDFLCIHRQRVESMILSSQISTDPQARVFLGGDTIQLTFNIGEVRMYVCISVHSRVQNILTMEY